MPRILIASLIEPYSSLIVGEQLFYPAAAHILNYAEGLTLQLFLHFRPQKLHFQNKRKARKYVIFTYLRAILHIRAARDSNLTK